MKKTLLILFYFFILSYAYAQDPHFTQFYAAPLTANPAYTGFFEDANTRLISNYRQQWISPLSSINTTSIQLDSKLAYEDENGNHPLSLGILMMNDKSMKGIYKSNYFSASGSYHITLDELSINKLGIGIITTYGSKRIDFSSLSFQEQYNNGGFDPNLPSGESGMVNIKSYITLGTGILFSHNDKKVGSFFDVGCSIFNFNKPKQSLLADPNQRVPIRFSIQSSFQKYLNDEFLINIKSIYQQQAKVNYILGGVSVAKMLGEDKDNFVGSGVWVRSNDAISPYVFLEFNNIQTGFTYDIINSQLKSAPKRLGSFEMSLQIKFGNNTN